MAAEQLVKRILWVAECAGCGERVEVASSPPRERFCMKCGAWVPYKQVDWAGPSTIGGESNGG